MRLFAIVALAAGSLGAQDSTARKETPPKPGTPKNFRVPPRRNFTLERAPVTSSPSAAPKAIELEIRPTDQA
jgi:hypothetical protein